MQKWKEQAVPYTPLLFIHYIHSLNTCVVSLLQTNLQVENFQTCKSAFARAIISVYSQISHTLSWEHPRQVGVLLCTLLYRTLRSTISVSRSVEPDSLWTHRLQPTRLHCPWDFSSKDIGVRCQILLQGIFATKGLSLGFLHCRQILYWLSYKGSWWSTIMQYF